MRLKIDEGKVELMNSNKKKNLTYKRLNNKLVRAMLKYVPIYFIIVYLIYLDEHKVNMDLILISFMVIGIPLISELLIRSMLINSVLHYDIEYRPNEITSLEEKYLISRFSKIRIEQEYSAALETCIAVKEFDGIEEEIIYYNDIRSISYNTISNKVSLKINRFQKIDRDLDSRTIRRNVTSDEKDTIFYYMIYAISSEDFLAFLIERTGLEVLYVNEFEELYYNDYELGWTTNTRLHKEIING